MPIFRVNTKLEGSSNYTSLGSGNFLLLADENTANHGTQTPNSATAGLHYGTVSGEFASVKRYIAIDQGLETAGNPPRTSDIPDDLIETAFLVRMDHRLLRLYGYDKVADPDSGQFVAKANSFVDDDAIATYYIGATDASVLGPREGSDRSTLSGNPSATQLTNIAAVEMFNGPLGPRLRIAPKASIQVQQSTALFDELGKTATTTLTGGVRGGTLASGEWQYIDTLINVVGVTTGYSIDIPIRIAKKI
jgi:hypothetical protein